MDSIRCPSCLKENDTNKLEDNTAYSCWSGPRVSVQCLHCDFDFEVECEHAGYTPITSFDVYAFMREHGVKIPENTSSHFVSPYLRDLVEGCSIKIYKSEKHPEYDDQREVAYYFALSEWKRIQNKIADYADAE